MRLFILIVGIINALMFIWGSHFLINGIAAMACLASVALLSSDGL